MSNFIFYEDIPTSGGGGNTTGGTNSSSSSSIFDYRRLLPGRVDAVANDIESGSNEDDDACAMCLPEISWRERLLGCATCMIAGYLLSLGSVFRLTHMLFHGDPLPLVLHATVGNILALAGSCFLTGPRSQVRRMWHESRKVATGLYLGSLVVTIVVAILPLPGPKGLLLLLLLLSQYVAITWYCLSYIPFAREVISGYIQRRFSSTDF